MLWDEIKKIFQADTKHQFYWMFHAVCLLALYELILFFSKTPGVAVYNGSEVWFAFFHKYFPGGTLAPSLVIILFYILFLYTDWSGIKNHQDKKNEEKLKAKKGPDFEPPPKNPFRPNWWALIRLAVEGLFFGALIFIFLRFITFNYTGKLMDGDFYIPVPIDANPALAKFHTNAWQNLALALGAGFYDEFLFRKSLLAFLLKKAAKYSKIEFLQKAGAVVLGALIFTLSHYLYPFGDSFSTYTVIYRFLFGVILSIIYLNKGFAVAAWTHASHDLFYFWLV